MEMQILKKENHGKILLSRFSHHYRKTEQINFLNEAHTYIKNATKQEFILHTEKVIHRIKEALTEDQIKLLGPKLKDLIEADGIVMNAELEISELIEKNLSIKLRIDKDL